MARTCLYWLRLRGELMAHLASLPIAVWALAYVALSFALSPFGTDLRLYYASARVAQQFGAAHVYDFALQDSAVRALGAGATWSPYLNPLTLTALALPFAQLPFGMARLLWTLGLLGAVFGGWWLSGVGHARFGRILLFAAIGWLPAFFALLIGQPALLVGAAVVAAVWLEDHGRGAVGAALLAVAVSLKPQLGLLIPLALLCGWRLRALAGFTAAGLPLAILCAVLLGPQGLHSWLEALRVASSWSIGRTYSLSGSLGGGWAGIVAQAGVVAMVVAGSFQRRSVLQSPTGDLITIGILGSLLITPYVSLQDFALLAFPAWLALARNRSPRAIACAAFLWLAGTVSIRFGAWPLLAAELSWLGWLAAARLARHLKLPTPPSPSPASSS